MRLTRRPAGLPTDSNLRSASVFNGASKIQSKSAAALKPTVMFGWNWVKTVGAGLLANAVCQSKYLFLTHRIREQARSHIWISMYLIEQ